MQLLICVICELDRAHMLSFGSFLHGRMGVLVLVDHDHGDGCSRLDVHALRATVVSRTCIPPYDARTVGVWLAAAHLKRTPLVGC